MSKGWLSSGVVDTDGIPSRDFIESDKWREGFEYDEGSEEWKDEKAKSIAMLADALGDILFWLIRGKMEQRGYNLGVFRKTIAMIWCLRPDLLGNRSLRELSDMKGIDTKFQTLSRHVSHFTKEYGMFHTGQRTKEFRKRCSDSYKRKQDAKKPSPSNKEVGQSDDANSKPPKAKRKNVGKN